MRPEPREIVELANEIIKAEEALAALRLKWDSYFPQEQWVSGNEYAPAAPTSVPKKTGKPRQEGSLQGKILTRMEQEPDKTFTAEFFTEPPHQPRAKVANTLAKLAYQGKINSRGRGLYSINPRKNETGNLLEIANGAASNTAAFS